MKEPITHPFIKEFLHFSEVKSTMEIAERYSKENKLNYNFVVCADLQTQGRGRKGHEWISNEGGLWFTLALYDYNFPPSLMIFFGLMLRRAISNLYHINECLIKWPNDVYLGIKKLSGIIATHNPQSRYHLIGIGINTNNAISQNPQGYNAISLSEYLYTKISHHELISAFLTEIQDNLDEYLKHNLSSFINEFNSNHYLKALSVQIDSGSVIYQGKCQGLNEDGALILINESGKQEIVYAGTVNVI